MIIAGMKARWGRYDADHVRLMYTSIASQVGVDMMVQSCDDPTIETFLKHSDEALEHIRRYELTNV